LHTRYSEAPKKLLIVGGGFGGLAVLEGLVEALDRDEEVGVALLDRVNFTTFYPMVPSGGLPRSATVLWASSLISAPRAP
jgi:NADH dehydrogenase FAD-containing subunit